VGVSRDVFSKLEGDYQPELNNRNSRSEVDRQSDSAEYGLLNNERQIAVSSVDRPWFHPDLDEALWATSHLQDIQNFNIPVSSELKDIKAKDLNDSPQDSIEEYHEGDKHVQ